jgi:hypothetical protein
MKSYRSLETAAGNIGAPLATLVEFTQAGWIHVVLKNGSTFVSGQDEYLAKFILHMRQKLKLTNEEIGVVLDNQEAPYSLDGVPAILARHHASK